MTRLPVRMYDPKRRDPARIRATRSRMKWSRINAIVFFLTAAGSMIMAIVSFTYLKLDWILIFIGIAIFQINRAVTEMTEYNHCKGQLMIDDLLDRDHRN